MNSISDMVDEDYIGIEVDMLSVGDGDAIMVTGYKDSDNQVCILIDGGDRAEATRVGDFLKDHNVAYIHHLVNTPSAQKGWGAHPDQPRYPRRAGCTMEMHPLGEAVRAPCRLLTPALLRARATVRSSRTRPAILIRK